MAWSCACVSCNLKPKVNSLSLIFKISSHFNCISYIFIPFRQQYQQGVKDLPNPRSTTQQLSIKQIGSLGECKRSGKRSSVVVCCFFESDVILK
ncbi:hypothetical protein L2E82_17670 [Cichorium intybus]|uniref:Uncharacterized protein n=1 Tax=Cichorium intybus TaxID=13427 RepID=A0ACB9F8Q3_CICIN|nr:hypothetical protein L2E82_17670 [Cichorium intybus]